MIESNFNNKLFEDLNGKFKARLKSSTIKERSFMAREGTITLTSIIGIFEASFDIDVLSYLEKPCFIVAKRVDKDGEKYLIYEVTAVKPIHYQMLSMSSGMPKIVRGEFLEKVDQSWGKIEDTWIDIYAVYTGYIMRKSDNNFLFERNETIIPLEGAESKLLSIETIEKFVNIENGVDIGIMEGFDRKLLIDLEKLLKYHGGVFGFTGVGKSNLTSVIVRKILENISNIKIAIIDIAGEYGIGLADKILEYGAIYTTEKYGLAEDEIDAFLASQAIPETFYEKLNKIGSNNILKNYAKKIFNNQKIRLIDLEVQSFEDIISDLKSSDRPEVKSIAIDLNKIFEKRNISTSLSIKKIVKNNEVYNEIIKILNSYKSKMEEARFPPGKLIAQIEYIIKILEDYKRKIKDKFQVNTPEDIAYKLIDSNDPERILLAYIPDPKEARLFSKRLIDALFTIRKKKSKGSRVLIILDEAQEFIPDKVSKEDLTVEANIAVEKLLRQGRKYRLHGWISTQRVAHLNVNAIQQIQSFFVGTLPREYDRRVIAEATGISPDILDKTAYLDIGEWMFVSFRATKLRNIPVFIKAENNEEILLKKLLKLS
jgi:DNA helicase HerA-like ATPase